MDTPNILCDELLQEIFRRLPPPSSAVSLVSKRWLSLFRSSTTSLSLHHLPPSSFSLSTFLSNHPFLSSLSLSSTTTTTFSTHHLLLCISNSCPKLLSFTFLITPLSICQIHSLPTSLYSLSALTISLSRPFKFHWLSQFQSLKSLSVFFTGKNNNKSNRNSDDEYSNDHNLDHELNLEAICLAGIKGGDLSMDFLWRNCKKVKSLKLQSCEGIGCASSFSCFIKCLSNLQEVELRKSRMIVDVVLSELVDSSCSLNSLLIYDGGSRESLLQFITQTRCRIRKIDLRLPLDLDNSHLIAMAHKFIGLVSLRLESCCLITGEGLEAIGRGLRDTLEELALIGCDVVDKEPGLLASLGQCLKRLRRLDLSYNEMLVDIEISSMLVSCANLCELKLRGCSRLSKAAIVSIAKSCKSLQSVDIIFCSKIGVDAVELLISSFPRLRQVEVEKSKLSELARTWASNYFIKVEA